MGGATGGVLGGAGGVFGKLRGSGGGGPIPPGTTPTGAVPENPSAYSVAYQMRLKGADAAAAS